MDTVKARLLLGLSEVDGLGELKRAYRLKARQYHPDIKGGVSDASLFNELNEAYRLLLSEFKTEFSIRENNTESSFRDDMEENPDRSFSDNSLYTFLDVTSEDAFKGSVITITTSDRETKCPRCHGSGVVAAAVSRVCSLCSGVGRRKVMWGQEALDVICGKCSGTGTINPSTCSLCRGRGLITHNRNVRISLPRGVRTGMVIKLPGQGPWDSKNGRRGDLYVEVNVTMPEGWELRGLDVYVPIRTDIWSVLAGDGIPVETMEGTIMYSLSSRDLTSGRIVIDGRGWVNEEGKRGRLIGMLKIDFPDTPPTETVSMLVRHLSNMWPTGRSKRHVLPYIKDNI